jgi:L-lysine exporter family protein LysE/ArgO
LNSIGLAALTGFLLVAGLIVAIGAQNAFILRQGLLRANVLRIVSIAFGLDASLIALGTLGFGAVINAHPAVLRLISWAGAAFVLVYGVIAFRRALHPHTLDPTAEKPLSASQAAKILLTVSLLNPHVYLDTVVLVGGVAGRYRTVDRIGYLCGAISASCLWFVSLGFGARFLAPIFAKPSAWRALDLVIGVVMLAICASLVRSAL